MIHWMTQIGIGVDQFANTLIPGGWADETLSSRAHRMRAKGQRVWGWTADFIDFLFFWQEAHCKTAYESEMRRWQLPPEFRN